MGFLCSAITNFQESVYCCAAIRGCCALPLLANWRCCQCWERALRELGKSKTITHNVRVRVPDKRLALQFYEVHFDGHSRTSSQIAESDFIVFSAKMVNLIFSFLSLSRSLLPGQLLAGRSRHQATWCSLFGWTIDNRYRCRRTARGSDNGAAIQSRIECGQSASRSQASSCSSFQSRWFGTDNAATATHTASREYCYQSKRGLFIQLLISDFSFHFLSFECCSCRRISQWDQTWQTVKCQHVCASIWPAFSPKTRQRDNHRFKHKSSMAKHNLSMDNSALANDFWLSNLLRLVQPHHHRLHQFYFHENRMAHRCRCRHRRPHLSTLAIQLTFNTSRMDWTATAKVICCTNATINRQTSEHRNAYRNVTSWTQRPVTRAANTIRNALWFSWPMVRLSTTKIWSPIHILSMAYHSLGHSPIRTICRNTQASKMKSVNMIASQPKMRCVLCWNCVRHVRWNHSKEPLYSHGRMQKSKLSMHCADIVWAAADNFNHRTEHRELSVWVCPCTAHGSAYDFISS